MMDAGTLRAVIGLVLCFFVTPYLGHERNGNNYYGKKIGTFQPFVHGITGEVYAVDEKTIFIKGFSYDGTAPDAFFWVGDTSRPNPVGYIVPYPEEYPGRDPPILKSFNNTDIILKLPQGKRIRDIKWLSVWCRRFTVNFSHVFIPPKLELPKPRVLPEFSRLAHSLRSGNISILDSKTFYIPNLHYDGAGPDAYFWVGNGSEPNTLGVRVPNEAASLEPLRGYQGEDIEIVLPGNLTVYDIDWLAVWCVQYRHNFGHVMIPKDLDVPPALGQTKITPPWWYNPTSSTPAPVTKHMLTNCKDMMNGRVQVQWETFGEDVYIRVSARIREDQYVAFGLSGSEGRAEMLGGDVVVVAYNKNTDAFIAEDYYMSELAQCDGKKGVCPDERVGGKNDVVLVHGERKNGVTSVMYSRPLRTNEPVKDKMIPEMETSVIAAIGPLNSRNEANAHQSFDKTMDDVRIDFTAKDTRECSNSLYSQPEVPDLDPWEPAVILDETPLFTAKIGPTGGKRGYSRITGVPSWGIAWYINDLLIPEITVERGKTYKFIVEGGKDPTFSAKYHPLYITNDPEGGFGQKTETQQMREKVFAGVAYDDDGYPYPTAAGRYCEWKHKTIDMSDSFDTFKAFFETLELDCEKGEPGELTWTVAEDTPDVVYYQCYTHKNLGWKIKVVDSGARPRKSVNSSGRYVPNTMVVLAAITMILASFR